MASDTSELRTLLANAEAEISQLHVTAEEHVKTISELSNDQTALEMQIILLNTQIADLEHILETSEVHLSGAMTLIKSLRDAIQQLRETGAAALKKARSSTSRVQMAATMYDLASKTTLSTEVDVIDEAEKQIADLRRKLQR